MTSTPAHTTNLFRWTVKGYQRLREAGFLDEGSTTISE